MNLLVNTLPETLIVDGKPYPINTDFRVWLLTILAIEHESLTMLEKENILVKNAFLQIPENKTSALEQVKWFMNGGKEYEDNDAPNVVSFTKDSELIYAAFRQTHGIDLTTVSLHWWQFLALIKGLDSKSDFRQLVNLRARVKSGKATKEEQEAARELGDMFDVPDVGRDIEDLETDDALEKANAEFERLITQGRVK